jgi:hypothetical protein
MAWTENRRFEWVFRIYCPYWIITKQQTKCQRLTGRRLFSSWTKKVGCVIFFSVYLLKAPDVVFELCCLVFVVRLSAHQLCYHVAFLQNPRPCLVLYTRCEATQVGGCRGIKATGFSISRASIYHKSGIAPWGKVNSGISVALLN